MREKVEKKIQELEDQDIIEKVQGPTPWVSQPVFAPKPHDPDDIRVCVDMRGPNQANQRERHIIPTIEEIISDLNGAKVFMKLDLKQGYHQLMLAEESRYITTFTTRLGLRRYQRLNFGISCASEIFQQKIREALEGIPGCLNISDDILVYAENNTQHDQRLSAVMQRLRDKGLTLNRKKVQVQADTA